MSLLIKTHLKLARISIKENRTRSFLTCLGIAIGVASIILILSLMGSISRLVSNQVKNIGADLIVVRPSTNKDAMSGIISELTASSSYQKSNLAVSDVPVIKEIEKVSAVAPIALSTRSVSTEKNTMDSVTVLGTTTDFNVIQPLAMRYGSFIDDTNENKTAVVGHTLALQLFNTTNPVGKTLTMMGNRFIVMGVLSEVEESINFNNVDFDNTIIVNIKTLEQMGVSEQIQQINIKAANTDSLAEVSNNIRERLKEKKSGDVNFTVLYGDEITHPAGSLFTIVSGMLTLVAAISLVVGGIGVMNIMLVSVAERTHEIGIRKAVGASGQNILLQFLFEALILSLLGGLMGLILGYILAFFVSIVTPFAPYISLQILLVTFGTALLVGVIFGIYPALKAASKNPIESLKHYR
ncbi:MAG: ABC transporter permease [Candidatus Saccharibacteria bacterium]|nr:ABC transporter permease [Candidatus Saccharibacteria bacterium]